MSSVVTLYLHNVNSCEIYWVTRNEWAALLWGTELRVAHVLYTSLKVKSESFAAKAFAFLRSDGIFFPICEARNDALYLRNSTRTHNMIYL